LGGLLEAGVAVGLSASNSYFLAYVGAASLPQVYLLSLAVMLVYISAYAWLIRRWGVAVALRITLGILTAGGLVCWGALSWFAGALGTPAGQALLTGVKLYALLWFIALYSLFWNFTDGYFDIQDAKRIFPLLSAGGAIGAAMGGTLVSLVSTRLGVASLFVAWSALSVAAAPALWLIPRRYRPLEIETEEEPAAVGIAGQLVFLGRGIRKSRFTLLLTALLFLTLVITTVCEFQTLSIFSLGRSPEQLADLFGRLFALANALNLIINLFFFNRLVVRLGVKNIALIQPLVYLGAFAAFFIHRGEGAAIFGFLAYQAILPSVEYNNVNFLLKALPAEAKREIRTVIEGICEPAAMAAAGGLLWVGTLFLSPEKISALGLLGVLACLALTWAIRGEYARAMVHNLRRQWVEFKAGAGLRKDAELIARKVGDSSGVAVRLAQTAGADPRERRAVELAVASIGLAALPAVLSVLNDHLQAHQVRSLAARIVARLAPAQLEFVAADLVRDELRHAGEYLKGTGILAGVSRGPGLNVLYHLHREIPQTIVDFVLEIHHLIGRLPAAELLASSLRSNNPAERSEALEILEQGLPRNVLKSLRPFIQNERALGPVAAPAVVADPANRALTILVTRSGQSHFPLERAASITALAEIGGASLALEPVRRLLRHPEEPELVRRTASAVLAGLADHRGRVAIPFNPIVAVDKLKRLEFFRDWEITELDYLISSPRAASYPREFPGLPARFNARQLIDCARRFPKVGLRLIVRQYHLKDAGQS